MPLCGPCLHRDNRCPCYFVATQAPWPLNFVTVKGKGHFVVVFFPL